MITRRQALKGIGALAAAPTLLGGCGDGDGGGGPDADPGPDGLTTIVVVCMENRSYDHYLGSRSLVGKPGDGLVAGMSNPRLDGTPIEIHRADVACVADPPHSWGSSHAQWNAGANDGFVRVHEERHGPAHARHVMGYMTAEDLPVTHALADAYASCDRWFASVMGPTWPNRMYLHSGQSAGMRTNDLPAAGEGFDWPTIWHRLIEAGIPWRYYFSDLPFVPLWPDLPVDGTVKRLSHFYDDAYLGKLPPVAFVEPAFSGNDDHPPHHPKLGQQFIASVYAALATSPQWKNVLLVVTYDEHGGFFDHVPPPQVADDRPELGFDQLGFRVPTVFAGPYVRAGHVSSVVHDHTSVLKQIERMHGLAPLTARDAAAADLSDVLDAERLAALQPAPPAAVPEVEIDESEITDACYARRGPPTDLELLADGGRLPRALDARRELRDTLMLVAEQADRLGVGRVRKGR